MFDVHLSVSFCLIRLAILPARGYAYLQMGFPGSAKGYFIKAIIRLSSKPDMKTQQWVCQMVMTASVYIAI